MLRIGCLAEFKRWAVQPQPAKSCKKDEGMPTATPFEGKSTYREQFPWRPTVATPRAKGPAQTAFESTPHAPGAMQSTYNAQFQPLPMSARESHKPKPSVLAPPHEPFEGKSTYSEAYKPHSGIFCPPSAKRESQREQLNFPFEGKSTYAEAYRAYGVQPRMIGRKPEEQRKYESTAGEYKTTHREHFKEVRLPPGSTWELGVQVVGGRFHQMIVRGARPPCEGKATFTTVVDRQESVEIVVVGRRQEGGRGKLESVQLGHFELSGIHPSAVGVPQVQVTLNLQEDFRLRVTALDKQRNHTRQIAIRELR